MLAGEPPIIESNFAATPDIEVKHVEATHAEAMYVEALGWEAASHHIADWRDLAKRALEANIYLEPEFAIAAAKHLTKANAPLFLLVWNEDRTKPASRQLIGLFAVEAASNWLQIMRGWLPRQAALGTPLLDREQAAMAFQALMQWISANHPSVSSFVLRYIASEGPVARLIEETACRLGQQKQKFEIGRRAELARGSNIDTMLHTKMSAKHRKFLRRGLRRLQELGTLAYESAHTPGDIALSSQAFLELEARGWKGRQHTALASTADETKFALDMLAEVTGSGKCHIDSLCLNGKPIAMGIILQSGEEAFVWKIAFDEEYASYSPGVQFMVEFSKRQSMNGNIKSTDSCAIPDHPMFSNIWIDGFTIADLSVATAPEQSRRFRFAMWLEEQWRLWRATTKTLYYFVTGRRRT